MNHKGGIYQILCRETCPNFYIPIPSRFGEEYWKVTSDRGKQWDCKCQLFAGSATQEWGGGGWGRIFSVFFLNSQRRKHTERRKKKYLDVHLSSIHSRKVEKTLEVVARFQDIGLERKEQCGSGTNTTNTNTNTNLKTGSRTSGWLENFGNTQMAKNFSN